LKWFCRERASVVVDPSHGTQDNEVAIVPLTDFHGYLREFPWPTESNIDASILDISWIRCQLKIRLAAARTRHVSSLRQASLSRIPHFFGTVWWSGPFSAAGAALRVRLLLLVNYRPEYRHEWSGARARISGDSPRITKTDGLDGGAN
jgi:hypothetical protein